MLSSHCQIRTDHASKYLQQLCKHFAHKVPATFDTETGEVAFSFGTSKLKVIGDRLIIDCQSDSPETLSKTEGVMISHLERFAFRENLTIEWQSGISQQE